MVARVRVTGGKGQQDVLFPSQELTYGSLVEADEKTFELMKTIGIKFDDEMDDATGVYLGTIDVSAVKSVNLSRLLSSNRRSYPIYLMDKTDELIGFWRNCFWFDDQNAAISRSSRYLEGVMMTSVPIYLA